MENFIFLVLSPFLGQMMLQIDDAEKSTVIHMVLTCSKQYLHKKKKRPNREHRCGAVQIRSEGQVRTFYNSRVPELG